MKDYLMKKWGQKITGTFQGRKKKSRSGVIREIRKLSSQERKNYSEGKKGMASAGGGNKTVCQEGGRKWQEKKRSLIHRAQTPTKKKKKGSRSDTISKEEKDVSRSRGYGRQYTQEQRRHHNDSQYFGKGEE